MNIDQSNTSIINLGKCNAHLIKCRLLSTHHSWVKWQGNYHYGQKKIVIVTN